MGTGRNPSNRMLKKSASFVLASLRGSTYGLGKRLVRQVMGGPGENSLRFAPSLAAALPVEQCVSAHRGGRVRTEAFLTILRDNQMIVAATRLPCRERCPT
jgi:hypothetical protein